MVCTNNTFKNVRHVVYTSARLGAHISCLSLCGGGPNVNNLGQEWGAGQNRACVSLYQLGPLDIQQPLDFISGLKREDLPVLPRDCPAILSDFG